MSSMNKKTLTVLGATGSIGTSTLDVVGRHPERFEIHALAARQNFEAMRRLVERFKPRVAVMYLPDAAERLRNLLPASCGTEVLSGMDGLQEAVSAPAVDHVVSGIVGAIGLLPTYTAIEHGKEVSLANKETLVLAGELMVRRAGQTGAVLLPMDSEHNAIFQCLSGEQQGHVSKIILTASGGPFRDLPVERFGDITLEQALAHPN